MRKAEWINYDGTRTMFETFRARVPRASRYSAVDAQFCMALGLLAALRPLSCAHFRPLFSAPQQCSVQLIYDYEKREVVAVNEAASLRAPQCPNGAFRT